MPAKPLILLAFANDQLGYHYLRDLPEERRQLEKLLQAVEDKYEDELGDRDKAPFEMEDHPQRHY